MRVLDISREFYKEFGLPMLEREFSDKIDRMAIGLVGHGSESFGYDDEISRDHDIEPGFCIWLTDEDEREFGFKLFRAYSKLPKEYMGLKCAVKSALGSGIRGVHTISGFYSQYTGRAGAPQSWRDWLYTPSYYLAEATNGEIFYDGLGEFSKIREDIKYGMPEDVRLKKIASCALKMAQSGQYNFKRCISHGEEGAARLALDEFARRCAEIVFLIEKRHMPYYKWVFRSMKELPTLGGLSEKLEDLLLIPQDETLKIELAIEELSSIVIANLRTQKITDATCDYLENHAYSINDKIIDPEIRNLHVLLQ